MTTRKVALLTYAKHPELVADDQLLIPELAKYDIIAEPVVWNDQKINWEQFDFLIFRNTWDYFEQEHAFNNWLNHIEKLGVKTLNPIAIIKKNKHKFYLKEMENRGIKIIPTVFLEKTNHLQLSEIIPADWKKMVIKPAFSAGSYLTEVFERNATNKINTQYQPIALEKELLLQKFMPEIQTLGETSFVFFDKKFSHAVNKRPVAGDFRIQSQFGGKYKRVTPTIEIIEKARKIVDTYPEKLLYARVDGIVIKEEFYLMEVECIEPDLYFNLCPEAVAKFAQAATKIIK